MQSVLDEEIKSNVEVVPTMHLQTPLERCISLLCVPPDRCNSVDWSLPDDELVELFDQGAHEYFQDDNHLPKALRAQFNAIVRKPPFRLLKIEALTHRDVVWLMAVRCGKIAAATETLTTEDAQLVASKAPRISMLLMATCAEVKTSPVARRSTIEPSKELIFSGATS